MRLCIEEFERMERREVLIIFKIELLGESDGM